MAAIRATEGLIIRGGGHTLAAGVTIETTKIIEWRRAMNTFYRSLKLEHQERYLVAKADVTTQGFDGMNEALLKELSALEPYGNGNREPVFCVQNVAVLRRRAMGDHGQHLNYTFRDAHGLTLDMKAWNAADTFTNETGEMVTVWFELSLNEWQGRRSIEGKLLRLETFET